MILIGINEGMNSSVVVLKDGEIIFAIQEERLNKIKEYSGFPEQALAFTLEHLKLSSADIDAVILSNLRSYMRSRESFWVGFNQRAETNPNSGLLKKIARKIMRKVMRKSAPQNSKTAEEYIHEAGLLGVEIVRYAHHLLHAASAYYGMRENAEEPHLVLTLDGGGDGSCAHVYKAQGTEFKLISETPTGHSVGHIYSMMTHYMGMKPHEHEYKLMGLAAYANPEYCRPVIEKLYRYLDLDPDNAMRFKRKTQEPTSYLSYRMQKDFKRIRFDNLAGGMQFYTEDLVTRWVKECVKATGINKIVVAGGVFMNVKANKLISEDPDIAFFDVMPSCGDETLPFGGVWYHYAQRNPQKAGALKLKTFCLGPRADFDWDQAMLKHAGDKLVFTKLQDPVEETANLIAQGHIVARCAGPMEFGARALGNRSLLADASNYKVIPFVNKIIKKRDFWMPFAPAMLHDDAARYIEIPHSLPERLSPFMMHSFDTSAARDDFICGVHAYDNTARAQTVTEESNADFKKLLEAFKRKTGKGVTLNTSLNLHGLPIVMGTEDALHVLLNSGLTHLIIEDRLVTKG